MTPRSVTVAIPVLNGARYLDEVLTAVRGQEVDAEVEILVYDSGSTDGSLEIATRHGARVHSLPKEQFSHGGTRNAMAADATGEVVAFLTQDATPAGPRWLASLLEGFDAAPDVAAVFGPHHPRPDASHMIKSEMERHFATWGEGVRVDVQRLGRSLEEIAEYRRFPGRLSFLSDVNCCVARWLLEEIPYKEVPYAEDQLLGREIIEAGHAKVFHPGAAVIHSHDYPPLTFLRRYFDEFRSLREVLGHVQPWGPLTTLRDIRGLTAADRTWLRARGVTGRALLGPTLISLRHHTIRMAGAIIGTRADRVPAPLRRRLSLEGRATFTPYDQGVSAGSAAQQVAPTGADTFGFIRRCYPPRPLALEPHAGRAHGPLTLAWVIPPWKVGSGGHTTIFRLIQQMEQRGHRCVVHHFDPFGMDPRRAQFLREEIRKRFIPIEAQVFRGFDDWTGADVGIATNWWTAFPLRDLPGCREKAYLVQDDERQFYPSSSEGIWAADTYRMGYRVIAYTPWMARILERDFGTDAHWFECGTDLATYTYGDGAREDGLIAVYARKETHRRAVELAFEGIATLLERRPGVRVALFGSNRKHALPFGAEDHGVLPPAELAALYRRASAGVVLSLTTHSLVAQEMMAAGLPLVELDGENVASALGEPGELAMLSAPRPDAIADSLERILDDREAARAMAERARRFVEDLTWERAGDQVESALRAFVASPTRSSASRA